MLDWVKSWSRVTWAMAWALLGATVAGLVFLFGPDTVREWVEAIWGTVR